MKRSEINPMPTYFDRYINLVDDVEMINALQTSLLELENAPIEKWKALGDKVYAEGKWTVKDLLQHLVDTERIFTYRALSFARKDMRTMLGFDEELFAKNANTIFRTLDEIIEESILVRKSSICLFQSFSEEALKTIGRSGNIEYSVATIAFILAGHQRWHFNILEERYFPLLT